jgi:DNA-binding transcriptional MerR regulator
MEATRTISELAEQAAGVLAASPQQANGRVRDVPNERLIRWYVTVGLLDPPLSRRGRVAQYGERHLLQLVAVKRRQAAGRSLAEIQEELAGATNETLAAIAGVKASPEPAPRVAPAATPRFWARPPAKPTTWETPETPESAPRSNPGLVHGLRLAPGVTLLLEAADREPAPDDVTAILTAAQPLLAALADRDLRAPSAPEEEQEQTHDR